MLIKRGFTLIELIIVIALIGILTTLVATNLQGARTRARDSRRKQDLVTIQQALHLYYNDSQSFPLAITTITPTYLTVLPQDPSTAPTSPVNYGYNSSGANYLLLTKLEDTSDSDIATSQARCPSTYSSYVPPTGYPAKDSQKDYVVCEE
ncbi:MAG: type II secretion system protein [bacterium]